MDQRVIRLVDRRGQPNRRDRRDRAHGSKAGCRRRPHAGCGHHQHPRLDAGPQTQPGLRRRQGFRADRIDGRCPSGAPGARRPAGAQRRTIGGHDARQARPAQLFNRRLRLAASSGNDHAVPTRGAAAEHRRARPLRRACARADGAAGRQRAIHDHQHRRGRATHRRRQAAGPCDHQPQALATARRSADHGGARLFRLPSRSRRGAAWQRRRERPTPSSRAGTNSPTRPCAIPRCAIR